MAMSTVRNRYAVVALALSLGSCQSAGPPGQAEPDRAAWRVLERIGEAHARAPGAGGWTEIMQGDEIPAASTLVTTGTGGRLILARPARQLAVEPKSRLRLAQAGHEGLVEQIQGRVRYRIAGARPAFVVATPALHVQASDTVLEVSVGAGGTEVTVEEGEARVATLDGRAAGLVAAGGSARGRGAGLLVRRALEQDYARVGPVRASRRPEPAAEPARAVADDDEPQPAMVLAGFRGTPKRPGRSSRPVPDAPDHDVAFTDHAGAGDDRSATPHARAASAQPRTTDHTRTPEHHGSGVSLPGALDERFLRFTEGLLGPLSPISLDDR